MKTILVADDSLVTRLTLWHILENGGYGVRAAMNGLDALDLVRREGADLILADINMPGLDGLALLDEMRQQVEGDTPPVILVTGRDELIAPAQRAGAREVLTKPISTWQVLDAVARVLEAG